MSSASRATLAGVFLLSTLALTPASPSVAAPPAVDKWSLWSGAVKLRGADVFQRRRYPFDGPTFLGPGVVGPPQTQADFDALAALGANAVELSHPGLYAENPPYVVDLDVQANLDNLVAMASQAGLYVASGPLTRPRGSSSSSTIATVSDVESAAGGLAVTVTNAPAGISVTSIVNTAGTASATVAAGCAATLGANVVTLQVSDGSLTQTALLTVNVTANALAPVVTPPSPATVTVNQTTCAPSRGATPNGVATRFPTQATGLTALLDGGTAVDDCTTTPTRLTAQVAGVDVTGTTLFPIGSTPVQIRFTDAEGNVGTAAVTVVVRRQADVDGNGIVDINDLITTANLIVGNVSAGTPPFLAPGFTADLDGDGDVDLFDLVLTASFIVGNVGCELS